MHAFICSCIRSQIQIALCVVLHTWQKQCSRIRLRVLGARNEGAGTKERSGGPGRKEISVGSGTKETSGMYARRQDKAIQIVHTHFPDYQRLLGFQASG